MNLQEAEKLIDSMKIDELFEKVSYHDLAKVCHPDRYTDPREKEHAEVVFRKLSATGDTPAPIAVVRSAKKAYEVVEKIATGDISDVYRDTDGKVIKVSRGRVHNSPLRREFDKLEELRTAAEDIGGQTFCLALPEPLEHFRISRGLAVSVFAAREDAHYSLEEVKTRYPKGIDSRDWAWMFRRLLTILGFAHANGIVHGAVLPSHVLICPETHGIQLIGWPHCVEIEQRITTISTKYKEFYPPEVFNKQSAGSSTDIFMAAKCGQWLLNGEEHGRIKRFFEHCTLDGLSARPYNAWQLHDNYGELLRRLYGKPAFRPFEM